MAASGHVKLPGKLYLGALPPAPEVDSSTIRYMKDPVSGGHRTIGRGGFGHVYAAAFKDPSTSFVVDVAVKSITVANKKEKMAVEQELALHSQLDHPYIIKMYGAIRHSEEKLAVLLERAQGGTLAKALAKRDRLPIRKKLTWLKEIAEAVAYMHERGIAHADLKPENILLTMDGSVRVADFGLCTPSAGGFRDSIAAGTPQFMAPEMFPLRSGCGSEGVASTSWASDVYAFALIAWELLSAEGSINPFDNHADRPLLQAGGGTPKLDPVVANMIALHRTGTRPSLACFPVDVPPEITRLIDSCWSEKPARRPPMATVARILQGVLEGGKTDSAEAKVIGPASPVRSKAKIPVADLKPQHPLSSPSAQPTRKKGDGDLLLSPTVSPFPPKPLKKSATDITSNASLARQGAGLSKTTSQKPRPVVAYNPAAYETYEDIDEDDIRSFLAETSLGESKPHPPCQAKPQEPEGELSDSDDESCRSDGTGYGWGVSEDEEDDDGADGW